MTKVNKIIFTSTSLTFAKRQLPLINEFEKRGYIVQNVTYSKKAQQFLQRHEKSVVNIIDNFKLRLDDFSTDNDMDSIPKELLDSINFELNTFTQKKIDIIKKSKSAPTLKIQTSYLG